jgi:DNA invertase Pin-like site-specific DNA recombinase
VTGWAQRVHAPSGMCTRLLTTTITRNTFVLTMAKASASKNDPRTAIGYLRVSTDDQALGPDAQRAAIERWAAGAGVTVVAWTEDLGVSGGASLDRRPGLLAAIDAAKANRAGLLVVAKRDRLARDPIVAAMTEAAAARVGARVVSAAGEGEGDDPAAILMRRMVDAFAEYERHLIKARTKAALGVKRARGERVGSVPIGFRAGEGKHLEADATEAAAVARVRELRAAGASVRTIAATLNAEGIRARGACWHPTTVARLLARAA